MTLLAPLQRAFEASYVEEVLRSRHRSLVDQQILCGEDVDRHIVVAGGHLPHPSGFELHALDRREDIDAARSYADLEDRARLRDRRRSA